MRRLRCSGFLVLLLWLAWLQPGWTNSLNPALDPTAYLVDDLSPKDRLENFETAWKAIRDNYYDPAMNGIKWNEIHSRSLPLIKAAGADQEFYELLEHMAGELHDAHTHVLSPAQAENFKQHQRPSLGF